MTSDARAQQARQHHRAAMSADARAEQSRAARDQLLRQLRAEDPARWTYAALAAAIGVSPERMAQIVGPQKPAPDRSSRR